MEQALFYKYTYKIKTDEGEYKEAEGFHELPASYNDAENKKEALELVTEGVTQGIQSNAKKYDCELLEVNVKEVSELEFKRYQKINKQKEAYYKAMMKQRGYNF